jgi:hypothetical protein
VNIVEKHNSSLFNIDSAIINLWQLSTRITTSILINHFELNHQFTNRLVSLEMGLFSNIYAIYSYYGY